MVISSCQIGTWRVGGFSCCPHVLYVQSKVLGKTETVPPRIHMQISLPGAPSNWFPLVAEEEKETCLEETFRWCITADASCAFLSCVVWISLAWWCLAVKTVQTSSSQKGMCIWRDGPQTPVWILTTGVWSYKTHQVKRHFKGRCLYWGFCLWDYSTRPLTEALAILSKVRSIWNC